jgi:hypothetical protein
VLKRGRQIIYSGLCKKKAAWNARIQWKRKTYSTRRSASTKHASRADADAPVFVHAPYKYPLMLVAVDMAQKNSVIAEYIRA